MTPGKSQRASRTQSHLRLVILLLLAGIGLLIWEWRQARFPLADHPADPTAWHAEPGR